MSSSSRDHLSPAVTPDTPSSRSLFFSPTAKAVSKVWPHLPRPICGIMAEYAISPQSLVKEYEEKKITEAELSDRLIQFGFESPTSKISQVFNHLVAKVEVPDDKIGAHEEKTSTLSLDPLLKNLLDSPDFDDLLSLYFSPYKEFLEKITSKRYEGIRILLTYGIKEKCRYPYPIGIDIDTQEHMNAYRVLLDMLPGYRVPAHIPVDTLSLIYDNPITAKGYADLSKRYPESLIHNVQIKLVAACSTYSTRTPYHAYSPCPFFTKLLNLAPSHVNLLGFSFSILLDLNLSCANLMHVTVKDLIYYTNFQGSNMRNARFGNNMKICKVDFQDVDLTAASVLDARHFTLNLQQVNFARAIMDPSIKEVLRSQLEWSFGYFTNFSALYGKRETCHLASFTPIIEFIKKRKPLDGWRKLFSPTSLTFEELNYFNQVIQARCPKEIEDHLNRAPTTLKSNKKFVEAMKSMLSRLTPDAIASEEKMQEDLYRLGL